MPLIIAHGDTRDTWPTRQAYWVVWMQLRGPGHWQIIPLVLGLS